MLRRCPNCAYVAASVWQMRNHAEQRGLKHTQGNWVMVPGQETLAVNGRVPNKEATK